MGHGVCIGKLKNKYNILGRKPKGYLQSVDWINVGLGRNQ